MLLGCLVALLAAAGAAAVFTLEEVHTLRDALNQNAPIKISAKTLANAGWGDPQTLLLVGNDQRKHTTTSPVLPHSNEMLLVRLDPGKPWISMMSIPRELMVPIHTAGGVVDTRLNAALTYGGIPLLINTIKQVTGLSVNHVVEIDFNNFVRAVNDIGCVYSTVDRRYYHVNVPGGEQYFQINLQPGYQRMCGSQALQFVSYRHGDTSLVRDARDQAFLLDVKKEYGPTLVDNVHKFELIFGRTVQTDPGLHSTNEILNLLGTLISSVSKPVRQVQFQVTLQPTGANPCSWTRPAHSRFTPACTPSCTAPTASPGPMLPPRPTRCTAGRPSRRYRWSACPPPTSPTPTPSRPASPSRLSSPGSRTRAGSPSPCICAAT